MELKRALVVLAFVATSYSSPINLGDYRHSICTQTCTESNTFNYNPGTTYSFKYESGVLTEVSGSNTENSGLHMTANVDIEVLDKCNMALTMKNVALYITDPTNRNRKTISDGSSDFGRALEARPLRFSFQDGSIDGVCTDRPEDEKKWVVNIKRGVLSSFQNTMGDLMVDTKLKENDVSGNCHSEYKVAERGWNSFTVKKTKDLLSCTDRHGFRTSLQTTPYRVNSDIQSLPLLKGTHECIQKIHKSGRLLKSECTEVHMFRPFSKENSGAMTKATHVLEFLRESAGVRTSPRGNLRRGNLFFEHEHDAEQQRTNILQATNLIRQICEMTQTDIRPETPHLFSSLVYSLRQLDSASLRDMHRRITSNAVCTNNHKIAKKYFHDAIPMVNSEASVALISALVTNQHMRGLEADMWVTSLAFIQSPTTQMLKSVQRLLEGQPRKSAFLSVSAMVNTFCKHNSECHRLTEFDGIANILGQRLGTSCKFSSESDRQYLFMALRAVGNMGHSTNLARRLQGCMRDTTNPIEIRLAAIDAYRRMPCSVDNTHLIDLFTNKKEDPEVRIAAYKVLMQCASPELLDTIKATMSREDVNQVASFVWSHLNNLLKTNDIHKQNIRKILDETDLNNAFDMDKRKFSRNYEASYFSDMANAGIKAESNVVFSPKSFAPRSVNLNLTMDLFGETFNLLEVGGRVEGLEEMAEKLFGPKGYFSDNSIKDTIKRTRRSINDINRIHEQYKGGANRDLKGNMYLRIFGHELSYLELTNMGGSGMNILDILIALARDHHIDVSKSFMFLDTTMTIPLMTGMPLKLSVNGTSTINLKIKGKMDMRKLGSSPRSLDITGYVKPSGAVEISSLMGVDAAVARTGLKMVTTLHSSTEVDGSIVIKDSQIVNVKFNMPRDKIEILNVENKFFIVHRETEREQKMLATEPIKKRTCTPAYMTKLAGVEVCSQMTYPNYESGSLEPIQYPLAGPFKLGVVLNKRDTHSSYEFEAKLLTRKNGVTHYAHEAKLAFNTPNSQVNRELLLDFKLNRADKALSFNLISPWKKVNMNGAILNNAGHKRLTGRLMMDQLREYSLLAEVEIDTKEGRRTITPNVEIRMHNRNTVSLRGQIDHSIGQSLSAHLSVENLFRRPLTMKADLKKQKQGSSGTRYDISSEFHSQIFHSKVKGFLDARRGSRYTSRVEIEYGKQRKPEHRMVVNYKMRDRTSATFRRVMVDTAIESSQYPDYDFHTRFDLQKTTTGHYEGTASLQYGRNPNDINKKIDTHVLLKYNRAGKIVNVESSASFKYPVIEADLATKLTANHRPSQTKVNTVLQWATGKQMTTDVTYRKTGETHYINGAMTLPAKAPISFSGNAKLDPRDLAISGQVNYEGRIYVGDVAYVGDASINHDLTANLQLPDKPPANLKVIGKLDPRDFIAKLNLKHNYKEYNSELVYSLKTTGEYPSVTGNLDLKHPTRRITSVLEFGFHPRRVDGKLDFKWDADRDSSKVFATNVNYRYENEGITVTTQTTYPGRTMKAKLDANRVGNAYSCRTEAEWSPTDKIVLDISFNKATKTDGHDINGRISLTSPFKNVKKVGSQFTLTSGSTPTRKYQGNAEVWWGDQKKIILDGILSTHSIKNFEIKLTATTPFDGYRNLGGHLKNVMDTSLSTKASIKYGNKGIDFDLRLDRRELTLKMMSPFEYMENAMLNLRVSTADDGMRMVELLFRSKPLIDDVTVTVGVNPTGWKNFGGKLAIRTPFELVKTADVELVSLLTDREFKMTFGGNYNGVQGKYSLNLKNNGNLGRNNVEFMMSGRWKQRMVELIMKHNDNGRQFNSNFDLTYNTMKLLSAALDVFHDANDVHVENNGNYVWELNLYQKKYTYNHSWRQKFTKSDGQVSAQHAITVNGRNYVFDLSGSHRFSLGTRRMIGTLEMTIPGLSEKVITKLHYVRNGKENLEAKLNVFSGVRIFNVEFDYKFDGSYANVDANLNLDVSGVVATAVNPIDMNIKTHYSGFPYTTHFEITGLKDRFVVDLRHERRSYSTYFTRLDADIYGKQASLQSTYEKTFDSMSSDIKIKTPYKHLQTLDTLIKWNGYIGGQFMHSYKVVYSGEKYQFTYAADQQMTTLTNHVTTISLTSNIPSYENVQIKFDQSLTHNKYQLIKDMTIGQKLQWQSTFTIEYENNRPSSTWVATINGNKINIHGEALYQKPSFNGELKFEFTPLNGELSSIVTNVRLNHGEELELHGDFKLTCHHMKNIDMKYDLNKIANKWHSAFEANVENMGKYEMNAEFKKSLENARFTMKTPHEKLKSLESTFEYNPENPFRNVKLTGELIYSGYKKASLSGKLKIKSLKDIEVEFTANAPSRNYELKLMRRKDIGMSSTKFLVDNAGSKFEFSSLYHPKNPFNLKVELKTPIQFISSMLLEINNDVKSYNEFKHKFVFEYNIYVARVRLENEWEVNGPELVKGAMRMTSPINSYEFLLFTVDHRRQGDDLLTDVEFNRVSRQRFQLRQRLNQIDRRYELDLETPWEEMRTMKVVAVQEGEGSSYNFKLDMEIPRYKLDYSSIRRPSSIKTILKLDTPHDGFRKISQTMELQLDDDTTDFGYNVDISKRYNFEAKYNQRNQIGNGIERKISITGSTPHDVMRSISIDLTYGGVWNNFKSNLIINHNKLQVPVYVVLNYKAKANAEFSLKGPVMELVLKYDKSNDYTYVTETNLRYGSDMYIRLNNELRPHSWTSWGGSLKLETSFERLEMTKIDFSHTGSRLSFTNNIKLDSQRYGEINCKTEWTTRPQYNAKVAILTPFDSWEKIELSLNHMGSKKEFTTTISAVTNTKRLSGTFNFKNINGLEAHLMLLTPFKGYNRVSAAFSHTGVLRNFRTGLTISRPGREYKVNVEFKKRPEIEVRLVVKTPYKHYKHLEFYMKHSGNFRQFTNTGLLQLRRGKRIDTKVIIDTNDLSALYVRGEVKTPYEKMKQLVASYRHSSNSADLTGNLDITFNGRAINTILAFKMPTLNDITGSITMKTPYTNYQELVASFEHKGHSKAFHTNGKIQYMTGKTISGELTFGREIRKIDVELKIRSPCPRIPNAAVILKFDANDKLDSKLQILSGLNEAMFDSGLLVAANAIDGHLLIKTPFKPMRKAEFKLAVTDQIVASFEVDHNAGKSEGSTTFKYNKQNGMELTAKVNTPHDISGLISATIANRWTTYSGTTNFQWAADKKITFSEDTKFTKTHGLVSKSYIYTPFERLEIISLELHHNGNMDDFTTNAVAEFGMGNKAYAAVQFTKGVSGILSFRSPFNYAENLSLKYSKRVVDGKDGVHLETSWAEGKKVTFDFGHKFSGIPSALTLDVYAKITTPTSCLPRLTIDMEHKHGDGFISNKLAVTTRRRYDTELDLEWSGTGVKAELNTRSPVPMQITMNLLKTGNDVTGNMMANWDTRVLDKNVQVNLMHTDSSNYFMQKYTTSVKVTLPWRTMGAENYFEKTTYKRIHRLTTTLDESRNRKASWELIVNDKSRTYVSNFDGELTVTTPLRTVRTKFSHLRNSVKHDDSLEIMWDAASDMAKKVTTRSVIETRGKTNTMKLSLTHPRLSKPISISGEVTMNSGNKLIDLKSTLDYSTDPRDLITMYMTIQSRGQAMDYVTTIGYTHPKSNSDHKITITTIDTSSRLEGGIEIKYVGKIAELRMEIDKLKRSLLIKVPVMKPRLSHLIANGKVERTSSGYKVDWTSSYGVRKVEAEVDINMVVPSIDLRLNHDSENPDNLLHLYARYLSHKELKIEAYRLQNGLRITDGLLTLYMNTTRLLHTRLHWRPNFYKEAKSYFSSQLSDYRTRTSEMLEANRLAFARFRASRSQEIKSSIPDVTELQNYIRSEIDSVLTEVNIVRNAFDVMYNNNEFFMQDISTHVGRAAAYIQAKTRIVGLRALRAWGHLKRTSLQRLAVYRRKLEEKLNNLQDVIAELVLKFRPAWQKYGYMMISSYNVVVQRISHTMEEMVEKMEDLKVQIVDYFDNQFDFISLRMQPYWTKFTEWRRSLRSSLANVDDEGYLRSLLENLSRYRDSYNRWAAEVNAKYKEVMQKVEQKVDEQMEKILGHRLTQMAIAKSKQLYEEAKRLYIEYEVEKNFQELVATSIETGKKVLRSQLHDIAKSFLLLDKSGFTVWDPKNGEIQAEIYLPTKIKQLNKLPEFNLNQLKAELNKLYRKFIPKSDYTVWDYFYMYRPSSDINNWLPPFKGHASILGQSHFVTFDHRIYDLTGSCSYVLAHDFVGNTFTFLINYENGVRKSITVISNNKQIEIFPDFKVTVDDRQTEVPIQFMNTSVIRHSSEIRIHNEQGFTVTCNMLTEICRFNVSGWYFGKTAGLLGTFTNEPADDFTTSSNQVVEDVDEFARSWQVGEYCRNTRTFAVQAVQTGAAADRCRELFESTSSHLRPGFKLVNPKRYLDMCLRDITSVYSEDVINDKLCAVSALYVSNCRSHGVPVRRPKFCAKCDSPLSSFLTEGQSVKIKASEIPATRSADVVFVVEEKQCNMGVAQKLQDLAMQIDTALKAEGKEGNRFGVVGFGGNKIHDWEQTHSMENLIFNNVRKVRMAAEILDFSKDGSNKDILRAVQFAAKYPYRAGVAKIVIALPCSQCIPKSVSYTEMQSVLNDRDIQLHILMNYDFLLRTSSPKSNYIFGADGRAVYTSKDVYSEVLNGDETLLRQVVMPKDICVELATQRKGSVFNIKKMMAGRVSSQKSFLDVFARRVAKTAKATECQICECTSDNTGAGLTVCKPCNIPSQRFRYISGAYNRLFGHPDERPIDIPEPDPMSTPKLDFNYQER
ncbi:uncharacterized protein LOC141898387 isoform X2 [Tubulanus polymorphus]|uniref:uncharacterized protein LOC141898387 isoform X2 n=1 Tax=Tubulanus polymorphus TaxID=672921 RepID=UPI003DA28E22